MNIKQVDDIWIAETEIGEIKFTKEPTEEDVKIVMGLMATQEFKDGKSNIESTDFTGV